MNFWEFVTNRRLQADPLGDFLYRIKKTRGPKSDPFDLSQGLFLNVVMSTDGTGALDWDCARR